jgi:hypothetical protein
VEGFLSISESNVLVADSECNFKERQIRGGSSREERMAGKVRIKHQANSLD